jgi:hypothetical protein
VVGGGDTLTALIVKGLISRNAGGVLALTRTSLCRNL